MNYTISSSRKNKWEKEKEDKKREKITIKNISIRIIEEGQIYLDKLGENWI